MNRYPDFHSMLCYDMHRVRLQGVCIGQTGILTALMMVLLSAGLGAQIRPVEGLHQHTPRIHALTRATIHREPGNTITNGTILIRDGLIEAVSQQVKIPPDAEVISMDGRVIYPGFIESYWEISSEKETASSGSNGEKDKQAIIHHWNERVHPSRSVLADLEVDSSALAQLRCLGFTAAHLVSDKGLFRGQTAVVHLSTWSPEGTVRQSVTQSIAFDFGRWRDRSYPNSLLGAIALLRQTLLDARWYHKAWGIYQRYPQYNERPEVNVDLAVLAEAIANNTPFLCTTEDELASLRAGEIATEFGIPLWVAGSGYEYRRLQALKDRDAFFIIPLSFPEAPEVATLEDELQVSLAELRHWDQAPDNPRRVHEVGIDFALTSSKLQDRTRFKNYLAQAIERGFDTEQALAALTTIPAERLGLSESHGKIAEGYAANLVVTDGNYFAEDSKVEAVWIKGREYRVTPKVVEDFRGEWRLSFPVDSERSGSYPLRVEGTLEGPKGHIEWDQAKVSLNNLTVKGSRVSWMMPADSIGKEGIWRFSGTILKDEASGNGIRSDGSRFKWSATRSSGSRMTREESQPPKAHEEASMLEPLYPEGAFGRTEPPAQPEFILVRNAQIWTSGPEGVIERGDLLIERGRISAVGTDLAVPRKARKALLEIDGSGKHVTPGLIDAHSHTALASVNEGTQAITSEVRARDVVNSDDIAIYWELAGGLTMANLLHGSANPIGGQTAVIKLRWGSTPQEMIDARAPEGLKMALGENVKQSNWGDEFVTRYPQTRMGVDQIIRDAFRAAQDYRREWETYNASRALQTTRIPPRRDLELEVLVDVLENRRWVHCHSYRQDEILNLIRIADDFGFTIGAFQHVLEGYKVAPEIAQHGAGASCFSDWWGYKFEVYDAIPYNGALMTQAGVVTSFNSDSDELARRLYTEAAKAVKYGGLSEEEALHLVTINPARQLRMERFVGSLEPGKDGDFVIWSGHPLSTTSRCEQTWIEGRKYFDLDEDEVMRNQQDDERAILIQKALRATHAGKQGPRSQEAKRRQGIGSGIDPDQVREEVLP